MAHTTDRRGFLKSALTAGAVAVAPRSQAQVPSEATHKSAAMVIRETEPENLESHASAFTTFVTETENFYVRSHFKQPEITSDAWSLTVDGAVSNPLHISYADLAAMPQKTMLSMLECAGNGRVYLVPTESGAQWQNGGMGNAEWTGVPLSEVLKKAGVRPGAVDVIFEGADSGEFRTEPKSPGVIPYARSLSVEQAMRGDVLIATRMNGKDLQPAHGYPVRVIVPGWYGMASVKWLKRITLAEKPFDGFFQSIQYAYWSRPNGIPTLVPIREIPVKSAIMQPGYRDVVAAGQPYRISGMAWAGANSISKVEVSTDGGATFALATLLGQSARYCWRMWEFTWNAPAAGEHVLMARATDSSGKVQPMQRDRDLRNYEITHVIPIKVSVR